MRLTAFIQKLNYLVFISLFSAFTASAQVQDTVEINRKIDEGQGEIKLFFPVNSSVLDEDYSSNRQQIDDLDKIFKESTTFIGLDSLVIVATASVDGSYANNEQLATNRANNVRQYLYGRYPQINPRTVKTLSVAEDWDGLRSAVTKDHMVPARDMVLEIIDSNRSIDAKEAALRALDGGSSWRYLISNILPKQRYGASVVFYYREDRYKLLEREVIVEREVIKEVVRHDTVTVIEYPEPFCEKYSRFAVKTNLLYGALTLTPNIGFEAALSEHITLDLGFGYNPWNRNGKAGDNQKLVHWMAQAEGRYFLDRVFRGHFFGVHVLGTNYNISNHELPMLFGDGSQEYRYCGWGAGIGVSYGYQWCLTERWALEANIGAGYTYLNYDKYTHPRCGYKVEDNVSDSYFGITRAGVSLLYKFGKKRD